MNSLDELEWNQGDILESQKPGSKFAKTYRKGLDVFLAQTLRQYQSYLKGFYFHSVSKTKQALKYYSESLETDEA